MQVIRKAFWVVVAIAFGITGAIILGAVTLVGILLILRDAVARTKKRP